MRYLLYNIGMIHKVSIDDIANSVNGFPFHIEIGTITEDYAAHSHDYSELFVILNGEAIHEVDNAQYKIRAGDAYLVRPNIAHAFAKVSNLTICNIMFKDESLLFRFDDLRNLPGFQALFILEPQFRKEHLLQNCLHLNFDSLKHVISLITEMEKDYRSRVPGFRAMFMANLLNLIVFLSRVYTEDLQASGNKLLCLANAVSFIESNFCDPIALNQLSLMAGLSSRQFTRVFKEGYGESPINYIINLRLGKAKTLLLETDLNVIDIAMECGFSDGTYFSKKFKSATGMTPMAYRSCFQK